MTDLNTKFTDLEEMINSNHLGITDALSTILAALGGAPEVSFASLVTAIDNNTAVLTDIHTDNNTKLDAIFNMLDLMNNNASLNAQRMLLLMLQTYCPCDSDTPLLPPNLGGDPTSLEDAEKCQRIQYFLDLWKSWSISLGVYLNDHGSISSARIQDLLNITLADVGITGSELNMMSTSTRDNISQFLNTIGTPAAINETIFEAMTSSDMLDLMRAALYAATNASDGKDAADAAMLASTAEYPGLFSVLFYSSWPNVMYSSSPVVDASAYDGDLCAPTPDCTDIASDGYYEVFVDLSYEGWTVIGNGDGGGIDLWTSNGGRANRWSSGDFELVLGPSTANNPPYFQNHGAGYYFGVASVNHSYTLTFCPPA